MNGIAYTWQQGPLLAWGGAANAALPAGESAWIIGLFYLALAAIGLVVEVGLAVHILLHPPRLASLTQRLVRRAWPAADVFHLGTILLALFALVYAARLIVDIFGGPPALEDNRLWIVLQSLIFHWTGLFLIVAYARRHSAPDGTHFNAGWRALPAGLGWGVVFYLATIPLILFYTLLYQTGLQQLGYESTVQEVAIVLTDEQPLWLRVYFMFMGIVLAPCFEEVLFRGVALPLLARRWGFVPAIFAVSALFALIHFHLPSLVPLFLLSAAFSLAYIYTGSILVPMVMHAIFNAVNLGLMTGLRGF